MSACVTCHTLKPFIVQHGLAAHQSRLGVLNSKGGSCVYKEPFLCFAVVTHHTNISGDTADVTTQFVYTCQVASSSISTGVLSSVKCSRAQLASQSKHKNNGKEGGRDIHTVKLHNPISSKDSCIQQTLLTLVHTAEILLRGCQCAAATHI